MASHVYVAGVGMIPFTKPGAHLPYPQMAAEATRLALADAGVDYGLVQQAYVGYVYGDSTAGQRAVYEVGMTGIPIVNVNNNCSTGSTALFLARQAVASGAADCVLALGFEQMNPGAIGNVFTDRPSPFDRFDATTDALVGQGDVTALAVVQQIDPLYVNFTQSANEALKLARAVESGQYQRSGAGAAAVKVVLDDGTEHPQIGKLLFADLTVDASSGQVTLRAEVPNPGGRLLPGLYVRVRLVQAQASQAIALPQQGVIRTPQGDSVLVVDGEGKVKPRPVKLGNQQGGQWVVLEGLKAGEQVMVDGFQKLRGDAPVKPVPWQAPVVAR